MAFTMIPLRLAQAGALATTSGLGVHKTVIDMSGVSKAISQEKAAGTYGQDNRTDAQKQQDSAAMLAREAVLKAAGFAGQIEKADTATIQAAQAAADSAKSQVQQLQAVPGYDGTLTGQLKVDHDTGAVSHHLDIGETLSNLPTWGKVGLAAVGVLALVKLVKK